MSADLVTKDKQEEDRNLENQWLAIYSCNCCDMTQLFPEETPDT
jgi:hypothetical protein